MFKVKYKYDYTGNRVYTVYSVHRDEGDNTFFLIYDNVTEFWDWVLASDYAPYIAED